MNTEMRNIKNILLVEDDLRDVELTLAALEEHHLANKVFVVHDGAEALDYLYHRGKFKARASGNPVLVLLDNKMPKINGLEVLKTIKADEHLKIIPVVVLTSSRETPDLIEFYKHGVNAYVVKPVDFSEFMKAVQQLGVFWAAVNEPPPPPIGREETPAQGGEVIPPGKKEVANEIPAPCTAPGR
jgi:CheY-like chemotaxis protein